MDSTGVCKCSRNNRVPAEQLNNDGDQRTFMHNLSRIKPQMMRRVLSFRDEGRNGSCHGVSQVAMNSSATMTMGLFPQPTGFAASFSTSTKHKTPAFRFTQETVLAPASVQTQRLPFLSDVSVKTNAGISRPASETATAGKSTNAPLTIFYNGKVMVYDVPAEKAQAIMILASAAFSNREAISAPTTISGPTSSKLISIAGQTEPFTGVTAQQHTVRKISIAGQTEPFTGVTAQQHTVRKLNSGLPIARKQSVQRFLEKRKERMNNTSPYTTKATLLESHDQLEKRCCTLFI